MKAFHPGRIHWRRLHPTHGWTFLVMGVYVLLFNTPVRAAEGLKLVEWLLRSGASTSQKCSKAATEISLSYTLKDSKKSYLKASCASCSVLDVVRESCQQVHKKAEWKAQEDQLRKVLMVFANASSSQASPRVSIHPGIMDIWEKFYAAKGSHDLTFETADGPVTAHAQVLKEASTVLSAMLQSSMKEGGSRRVEVNDTPGSAVSLFLELLGLDTILYTCSSHCKPDYKTALHALDLAHRWQVEVVTALLVEALREMITDESFAEIAEHAVLKAWDRSSDTVSLVPRVLRGLQKHEWRILAPFGRSTS
ncbi:unnamed protein product [Durusdinium trenchii]|uniref:BTB domain-containing protein n=2 Tax=Durusdinium trenchii TaxID=1381693 RepID=A0ABP0KCT0_9DINO